MAVAGCRQGEAPRRPGQVPQVAATVVTIRTATGAGNKTYNHSLFISDGVARSGDEVDVWHLYDPAKNRVTTVDEIAGTHRVFALQELVAVRRRTAAARANRPGVKAEWSAGEGSMVTHGVQTRQSLITAGAYRRELWFGTHPQIPARLHPLMYLTRLAESDEAGVSPRVDDVLLNLPGYPMIDRAELPYGNKKMTVERSVVRIEQKQVPRSWFELPKKSRDITPAPPPKKP